MRGVTNSRKKRSPVSICSRLNKPHRQCELSQVEGQVGGGRKRVSAAHARSGTLELVEVVVEAHAPPLLHVAHEERAERGAAVLLDVPVDQQPTAHAWLEAGLARARRLADGAALVARWALALTTPHAPCQPRAHQRQQPARQARPRRCRAHRAAGCEGPADSVSNYRLMEHDVSACISSYIHMPISG
eukprot:scaffold116021_cov32-Tisochrysis_lutea.AAC.3